MTAKEMFEKLGYVRDYQYEAICLQVIISYRKDDSNKIEFDKLCKSFCKCGEYDYADDITLDEFKAINKQLKELGWIK